MCSGIKVKAHQGDAPECDTECDPQISTPNTEHTDCGKLSSSLLDVWTFYLNCIDIIIHKNDIGLPRLSCRGDGDYFKSDNICLTYSLKDRFFVDFHKFVSLAYRLKIKVEKVVKFETIKQVVFMRCNVILY